VPVGVREFAKHLHDLGDATKAVEAVGKLPLVPCILSGMYYNAGIRTAFKLEYDGEYTALLEAEDYALRTTNHFEHLDNPESWGQDWECDRLDLIDEHGEEAFTMFPVIDEAVLSTYVHGTV